MIVEKDRHFMRIALQEARKGIGKTSPNPCVGAVIVKNNRIIAKGYHKKAGEAHAEINALRVLKEDASGATIYVTLEPCSHVGRTPPCCRALAENGITRVVVGMEDPNTLVHGGGIAYLRDKGIEVVSGVLDEECRAINRPFIKYITTSIPWVIMKAGISLDGRITYRKGDAGWITGTESQRKVHKLRNLCDALLVGIDTVIIDNPSLTTRLHNAKGKDPIRIVLDTNLRIPLDAKILGIDSKAPNWIFCGPRASDGKKKILQKGGAVISTVDMDPTGGLNLIQVLKCLGKKSITSVLVEGGSKIHGSMLRNRLVDHVNLFFAPLFAGDNGIPVVQNLSINHRSEAVRLDKIRYCRLGNDMMIDGDVCYPS